MAKVFRDFPVFWAVERFFGRNRLGSSVGGLVRADLARSGYEPRARARGEAPRRLKELGVEYQLQFTRPVFTPLEFQELVVCYKFQF
jgi:hypothetical protein